MSGNLTQLHNTNDTNNSFSSADSSAHAAVSSSPAAAKPRWNTRELVTLAVFSAMAAILSFIEIALFPPAPFLKYDPSGVIALIAGFIFGPFSGSAVAVISWLPRIFMNPIGALMNIAAALALIFPAAAIYRKKRTRLGGILGMVLGGALAIIVAVGLNFIATPLYYGGTVSDVMKMILPILVPFNLIKIVLNCVIVQLLYKSVHKIVGQMTNKKTGRKRV
ncbi:ECF transporter S component [Arcanobacterium hippocoleae]